MDALSIPETNQIYVVIGGRAANARLLDLSARLALRGPLLLFDCGNRANPLPIVRELRRLTIDPLPALENVRAARAFTCYQVAALLERMSSFPGPQPILIFDLLATFYDESVPFAEGQRLLRQCLARLLASRHSGPLLVSARLPPADFPERQCFLDALCKIADQTWLEVPSLPQPQQQYSLFS